MCRVLWNTEGEQCARSSALAGLSVQGGLGRCRVLNDSCAAYYGLAGQSVQGGMEGSLHLQYAQYVDHYRINFVDGSHYPFNVQGS